MKNVKINLDRPALDSKSIQNGKDFDGLLKNHAVMSKPYYKSPWFIGTTGLASIGLVVGGIVAFNSDGTEVTMSDEQQFSHTAAPPERNNTNQLIAMNQIPDSKDNTKDLVKETFSYSQELQKQIDDKTNTLDQNNSDNTSEDDADAPVQGHNNSESDKNITNVDQSESVIIDEEDKVSVSDLMPRIGGKLNGSISREELLDNKGITTESDVNVIHFELHLIDGLGGKVFEEESNQLNEEMKQAIEEIRSGETIYFENIKGKTDSGEIVRLNPLRYVLMN